ncbi:MAG: HTTM domain-containing protein [Truepera sp.]|nr:HTTM domain-containing protein [Truepera sp.]
MILAPSSPLAAWLPLHLAVPLRHYLTPSIVHRSEEGHRFTWHMKPRGKEAEVRFFAFDPKTQESWSTNQLLFLTSRQIQKMSSRPYMIRQLARYLAAEPETDGREGVEIRVESFAALNGRPRQLLIDPEADLAAVPAHALRHNPGIVPLKPLLQTSR